MSKTGTHFRTVAFGGFHKQDVLNYITSTSKETQERDADLLQSAESAKVELESLKVKYESAEAARKKNAEDCERMSESLAERTIALEQAERELANLKAEHEKVTARLAELEERLPHLEESTQAYAELKDHTATIEMEAHRQAQEILEQARSKADKIRGEIESWLRRVQSTYQMLRTDVTATMTHLSGELERSKKALDEATPAFCQHDEALTALLESERETSGPKLPEPLPLDEQEETEANA